MLFTRYRNDVEYVKVWVAYADLLPDPAEVFKFLHLHRIGEDCSLTYIAWAWVTSERLKESSALKTTNFKILGLGPRLTG